MCRSPQVRGGRGGEGGLARWSAGLVEVAARAPDEDGFAPMSPARPATAGQSAAQPAAQPSARPGAGPLGQSVLQPSATQPSQIGQSVASPVAQRAPIGQAVSQPAPIGQPVAQPVVAQTTPMAPQPVVLQL